MKNLTEVTTLTACVADNVKRLEDAIEAGMINWDLQPALETDLAVAARDLRSANDFLSQVLDGVVTNT